LITTIATQPIPERLTDRCDQALIYASQLHRSQRRKLPPVPYICHLLGVASLVIEDGGDEDEAIAALLHDAIEDQGGMATGLEIQHQFGDRVYAIVQGCTVSHDTHVPWRSRQQQYFQQIIHGGSSVHRVVLADKLHNGRSLLGSLHQIGNQTWQYFHGSAEDILWFYQTLLTIFTTLKPGWMAYELSYVVQQLAVHVSATPNNNRSGCLIAQPILNPLMQGAIAPP
jgi:(p)ppGpp synthase/HD superfamily hydrolase